MYLFPFYTNEHTRKSVTWTIVGYLMLFTPVIHSVRGREPGRVHETLMITKHEMYIDFYGASER